MQSQPSGAHSHPRKQASKASAAASYLNCMIIEQNDRQSNTLRDYIIKTPKLHYAGKSETPAEIHHQVVLHKVDILFWDIKMLDANVIHRLRESGLHPIIICLSTKTEQEKKETDLDIFSYLTKPLSFERYLTIVNKIKDYLAAPAFSLHGKSTRFLFVKSEYRIIKVDFEDILFCEGMKDYTQIHVKGKSEPILTLNNLKLFFSKLPPAEFIRVHRSYIVSIRHIDSIARNEIYVGKKIIPVGDSYKDDFYQMIESNS